jgi:hypothetical protein
MRLPSTKVILFNAAIILAAGGAVAMAIRSALFTPSIEPCTERYFNMTVFALERNGAMITPAEVQAVSGGRDAGVMENVSIVRKEGPSPIALQVNLAKGASTPHRPFGMSFPWAPNALAGKTRACLTYNVQFPAGFDFHRGGRLPGLGGGIDGAANSDTFAVPVVWRSNGTGASAVRTAKDASNPVVVQGKQDAPFAKGRWIRIEQEIVLNTLKKSDGIVRVWADGALMAERTDVVFRSKAETSLSSVLADVHYGSAEPSGGAPKDANIWLSPLEVRWQ